MMYESEVKKLLESLKNNKDFISGVKKWFGNPEEWDIEDDSALWDMAELFQAWNEDKTVLRAREIIDGGYHFEMKKPIGVEAFHVYNGIMSEFPEWYNYDNVNKLLMVAREIIEHYYSGN